MSACMYNVRDFGAVGDGQTIDSPAINAAITAAAAAGGGEVVLPAGTYASYSIRLRSRITLRLASGATLRAAPPPADPANAGYDTPEPNPWGEVHQYQDFGHSHWHNSLVWGEELEDIAILGPGWIDGAGLHHGLDAAINELEHGANKAIALKRCRGVLLRDLTIVRGGHFAVLATGVDRLTIDHVTVDTQRDGLDLDCCRAVQVTHCRVNTPHDDAIVLKTSFALGERRATENVLIHGCTVSGYDLGTLVDGRRGRAQWAAPDGDGPTGRIKLGTESHGDFRDITITDCTFLRSRGVAIESVDGAVIENVTVQNLVMREIVSSPIFVRLGARLRGPQGTTVGAIRGLRLRRLMIRDADARFAALVSGLPDHPIEDLEIADIDLQTRGGLTRRQVEEQPAELVSAFFQRGPDAGTGAREMYHVPERPAAYPEPSMFGVIPACGLYARHVQGLRVANLRVALEQPDERAVVVLQDVAAAALQEVTVNRVPSQPLLVLRNVDTFNAVRCGEIESLRRAGPTTEEIR